jgi:hypothetical protein
MRGECEMKVPENNQQSLVIAKPKPFKLECAVRDGRAEIIKQAYEESWKMDCLRACGAVTLE